MHTGPEGPGPDGSGQAGGRGQEGLGHKSSPAPQKGHLKPKNVKFTKTDLTFIANKIDFYYFL